MIRVLPPVWAPRDQIKSAVLRRTHFVDIGRATTSPATSDREPPGCEARAGLPFLDKKKRKIVHTDFAKQSQSWGFKNLELMEGSPTYSREHLWWGSQ